MGENLTKSDIDKINEEIEYRKYTLRPKLLESLKEARAQGDLSENFEYYVAKRDNNRNNSRIRYLEKMITTANIIEDTSKDDEVGINTSVTLFFEEDNMEETVRIVTGIRSDSLNGLASIESPLGKALMGHKEGDRVSIKVNDNYSYYVVIKKIEKNVDDSGDHIASY
ncbi:MAG: transcription elongation factor GreA [Lachnospiraceae bacterium]|nr:transcription elongation factor GreA [Lachnospiraceae bacterium]